MSPFDPPPGTRFPRPGDERLPFEPRAPLRGKVDFTEILAFHSPTRSRFTLLATHEFEIIAAACFTLRTSDIFIDFLVRNDVFRPPNFVAGG